MSKLPLNSDEWPERLLSGFHGVNDRFIAFNNIACSKQNRISSLVVLRID